MLLNPKRLRGACRAIGLAALLIDTASAQPDRELPALINAYRSQAQACQGNRRAAVAPLAPDAELAGVQMDAGGQLQEALKQRGYQAAQAQAIIVTGPTTAGAAMEVLKQRYCEPLSSTRYSAVGVSRHADTWTIVLARPLLAADLGDWSGAGKEVLRLTNAARAEPRSCGGKPFGAALPLVWNDALAAASLVHSRDMAKRNYFSHRGADGSQVGERATREGYRWQQVGENIAAGQGSPEQALAAWLSSPPHCTAIMTRAFTEMGAAYALNPDSERTIYWTQVFGTPR